MRNEGLVNFINALGSQRFLQLSDLNDFQRASKLRHVQSSLKDCSL